MSCLTEQRRRFVIAYCELGDARGAAKVAGYSDHLDAAKVRAFYLMRDAKVLAAIREEADRRLDGSVFIASNALVEIASDPNHRDRYRAAADLLDRRGFIKETRHTVTVKDERTEAELVEFIQATAKRHGLDPRLLLGPGAIEGEFKEVKAEGESA